MFSKLFGKPKEPAKPSSASTVDAIGKLNAQIELLEKRQKLLEKKMDEEKNKALEYTKAKNKRAALMCLKRKKAYEQQSAQLENNILRVHEQVVLLEGARTTVETVDALRTGATEMKNIQKQTNIEDLDKTMDDIQEQTDNLKQMQDALGQPLANDIDEDELEAELQELEAQDLDERLLSPAEVLPSRPAKVPAQPAQALPSVPAKPVAAKPKKTAEEEELEALEKEMALA
eukprot:jgi/Mesvir1/16359/Mv18107-RA.1